MCVVSIDSEGRQQAGKRLEGEEEKECQSSRKNMAASGMGISEWPDSGRQPAKMKGLPWAKRHPSR